MVTIIYRRLDKIRLLRRYLSMQSQQEYSYAYHVACTCADEGKWKRITDKYRTSFWKPYPGNKEGTALRMDFFSVQKKPAIAVDCNPRKLTAVELEDVQGFLITIFGVGEVWNTFRLSSIEIAIDVRAPTTDYVFLAPAITEIELSYLSQGTLYLGSKYGHRRYCIYDKAKQVKDKKKGKLLSHPLTRIEVKLRVAKMGMNQLSTITNPFGRLIAAPKMVLDAIQKKHPTDYEFGYFRSRVLNGLTGQLAYLEQEQVARKRIVKLLRPYALNLNGSEEKWKAWITKQQADLSDKFKHI